MPSSCNPMAVQLARFTSFIYLLCLRQSLLVEVFATKIEGREILKKCCPMGESLEYDDDMTLGCSPMSVNSSDPWSWWPNPELLDKDLLHNTSVLYEYPLCHPDSMDYAFLSRNLSVGDTLEFELQRGDDGVVMTVMKYPARHYEDVAHPTNFPSSTFCVDSGPEDMFVAFLCPCDVVPCVRKCCDDRQAYNVTLGVCHDVTDKKIRYWVPVIEEAVETTMVYYRLTNRNPVCRPAASIAITVFKNQEGSDGNVSHELVLQSNASLQTRDKQRLFPVDDYCADFSVDGGEIVHYCLRPDATLGFLYRVYGTLFLIGAAALLLTVALTLLLPDMRRTLHQKMALMHNVMLFVSNTTVAVNQLSPGYSTKTCKAMSFVIQCTLLAAFFWLNSMCIDITWVFSGRQQNRPTAHGTTKKFWLFALYSWGSTCLITCIMAVFEFSPSITILKPNFGEGRCFFNNRGALWLFLYGPIGVILVFNFALFVYTTARIIAVKKETSILSDADSRTNISNRQSYLIFTKLFCLMGLMWVTEIMGLLLGGPVWAWLVTDTINLLEGVFIFIIFCCNSTVYNLLRTKLRRFATRVGLDVTDDSKSTTTKSSSMEMENVNPAGRGGEVTVQTPKTQYPTA